VKPVEDRDHYERLVRYLLVQPSKHELPVHPALWEGPCFLDPVGARLIDGFDRQRLVQVLPRSTRWDRP
jgi:hypothetical protein